MRGKWLAMLFFVVMSTAFPAQGAAPPVSWESIKRDLERAEQLRDEAYRHALAGRFADARRLDRETLRLRSRWVSSKHRLVQQSKQDIENWSRLADLPRDKQKQLGNALRLTAQGERLVQQGRFKDAQRLCQDALEIRRKVLGEEHPDTATSYNNVAFCLGAQSQHGKALPMYEKSLNIYRKLLGEEHVHTAASYDNLALCLGALGQYVKALLLHEKAMNICRNVLGEEHPDTAQSYHNVASCLHEQGQHGRARPLFEKALNIWRKVLGEVHPHTATCYNNLAACLNAQGQHSTARSLYEKALRIRRQVLGEEHPHTATCYNNVAICLHNEGQYNKALPLHEKALLIRRQVLGEEHPDTAQSYLNAAGCLSVQGQHGKALPLYEKALNINRKVLGEEHPDTAICYGNVAGFRNDQGQYDKALPLYEKALNINRKVLGEEHPHTTLSYDNTALCLWHLNRIPEATRLLQRSLPGQEVARFHKAASGFDRAIASRRYMSPRQLLALGLARLHQPSNAFAQADAGLARALLDDLVRSDTNVAALENELGKLDDRLVPLFGKQGLSREHLELREQLIRQRHKLSAEVARTTAIVSAGQLVPLADIQKQIPVEAAVTFWIDLPVLNEFQACVLRTRGTPTWVRLPGSSKGGKWAKEEQDLHGLLHRLLGDPQAGSTLERQKATVELRKLRLDLLLPQLQARDGLPAVRHLLVVPTGWAAAVPVEVLTSDYRVSYVPSPSAFARMRQQARPLSGTSMLAVGDPAFTRKSPPHPETLIVKRGPAPVPLPGARREVAALAGLFPKAITWLGSDASEQRLDELIAQRKLKNYRLVHLATHGQVNWDRPELSSLALASDDLPDSLKQAQQGKKVYTGDLTVDTIRREWRDLRINDANHREWRNVLDADLVVLSACVTALGKESHGDGMLGFAQAFLSRGARCVVLSRWYVNDDATALLMQRFYQNLLGKRPGLKKALGRAEALEEARNWLRNLSRTEAGAAVASLPRGTVKPLPGKGRVPTERAVPPGEKPYAHPYYWSAFVLIGDPD